MQGFLFVFTRAAYPFAAVKMADSSTADKVIATQRC
jgi:hypothetical protein